MNENTKILNAMFEYYRADAKRIHHLVKVYSYVCHICEMENVDVKTKRVVEIAAILHDIGIKNSEKKYGDSSGEHQEIEGPPEAEKILKALSVDVSTIKRCCWLIANHHTYSNISDIDHQILVEADFLVNAYEEGLSDKALKELKKKIFRTRTGINLLENLYNC